MTKAEKRWLDSICRLGCICCRLDLGVSSPAEPHHLLLKSGRRMGHLFTIPLCPAHHRGQRDDEVCTSRHPYRDRFELRYGTEALLLEKTRELVGGAGVRRAAKVDDNQPGIIEALRACSVSVWVIGKPLDLLICHRGETALMEVKNPDGKDEFTKDQVKFMARWPGKIHIVRTVDEALRSVLGDAMK